MDRSPAPVETWERRHGAALAPLVRYRRREREKSLLHAVMRDRLEPFLAAARDRSPSGRGLPAHVERDLRACLDCGLLCRGFARIRCPINEPAVARKILDHLGLASQAPPLGRAGAVGEELACDPGPDYSAADPTPED